jgi:hypothetical protein
MTGKKNMATADHAANTAIVKVLISHLLCALVKKQFDKKQFDFEPFRAPHDSEASCRRSAFSTMENA